MAKQVSEILVKLGIQGFEGLDKLKSSFRGLEKAIGPTDSAIQTARQSIIDFAGAGKQSIQSIQGQIDAFKGLQTQATIGGNVYRQLAGDVNRLSDTLKGLKNDYEEVGRAARQTDKQIAAQFPARRPEAFRQQLAALNRQLDQLSVSARAYGDALTEITIRETAFGRAQARQGVIAGAQAVGAPLIGAMQPQQQLPNTLAALQLRISELSQDFQNLDRASQPYQDTLAEINRLQSELSRATEDGNADRKEEIRARIENYRQITAENTALREQAAIRRSVERGRARAGAGAMATVQEPARRTSALFQSVAEIGLVGTRQQTELIGKSYSDVADTIQKLSAASNGSIQSLQAQRGAWQTLRGQVNPASNDFRRASKEIEQLDRRLGKLQQTQSRRMSGMQMAQAAGAAISGGIFGGPEGFLGGAIGGITGGVGGAFVGAAAGAQVGMLRQQLGGFADYAAQIQKMEIALKNAAGSQDQFNQAVAAANSAVRNLNVPQDVAIQGMTRLTAAVKGAGGQVSDAELVFKNVTSAIKATGGSAEDVDGAITAMVQVFSKGKVSAEELSGQLGERLPGAVTKFAKANDMTLPELQKALEQGQVGLNELMNFIVQLGDEYSGVAQQIADSSQDAGARLTVAFNNMRIAVGEALQPIGAEFQEAFIPFIESITPALVAVLPVIGDLALGVAKNLDVLAASLGALAAGAIVNAISLTGGLGAAFASLKTAILATNAALLLNPWVALAAGIAAATVAIIKHSQAQKEYNNLLDNGAGSSNELRSTQRDLEAQITAARKALEGSGNSMGATGRQAMQLKMKIAELENQLARINKTFAIRLKLEREGFEFDESGRTRYYTVAGVTYDIKTRAPVRGTQAPSEFPQLTSSDSGGSAKSAADKAARDEQRIQERLRNLALETESIIRQALFKGKIAEAEIAGNKELAIKLRGEARAQQISQELERSLIGITDERVKQALLVKSQAEIESAGIDTAIELEQQRLAVIKEQNDELFKRANFTPQDAMREGAGAFDPSLPDLRVSPAESQMNKYREELEALSNPISMAVTGANAIGDAFGQAFQSIVTGSQSTQQALSNAFKAIGEAFIQMATEIIAKQIAMIVFQTILKALGGSSSFGFSGAGPAQLPGGAGFAQGFSMPSLLTNANGNAFAQNGIQPFAMGGIVTKPTFFKYADGGTFNNGVMGEAGPEAIMPLKRGADGKLGVAARLDGAMKRYRSTPGSAAAAAEGDAASLAAAGAATMEPIDVRYSVERINSVDYVTADQFQAGMAQAAQQGALQGERRAMRSLKNSSATRRSVGI
jgi:tape measure domain-containing protein